MNNSPDKCEQLRKLHANLVREINTLKESVEGKEHEGVQNPVETLNIIKSLEGTLYTINLELQKCPPENP